MNSSGILKRGLAATAISALAVAGIPALAGTANAAVGSVTVTAFDAYDIDEFSQGDADDIVVTVKETGGAPTANQDIEYSYVFTPEAGGPALPATPYVDGGTTDATGKANLSFVPVPGAVGTYVVSVRTVGSQIAAAPFTIQVGEAELYWADGASASSPVNGSDTYSASLLLTNAAKSPLVQRDILVSYATGGDAAFGPQTVPSVRVDAANATSRTGADGSFTVSLTDPPATPGGVAESGDLVASAPDAAGAGDAANANATDSLEVNFEKTPVVKAVSIDTDNVFAGAPAPGKPVELNIKVTSEGPTAAPGDDIVLKDAPVTVTVDKGFLTPDTKGEGMNVDPTDLDLTDEQDDEGDLFGFYESLGASATVDSSDDAAAPADNAAGIVATIEQDAGFNDDGLVTQTVNVTAGGKSAQTTITYDSRNYLNLPEAVIVRDGGDASVPGAIDLKLGAFDQYRNLVGGLPADVTDNTPAARVDAEDGGATTDYINDNPTLRASSNRAVQQVITARIPSRKTLVNPTGDPVGPTDSTTTATHTIDWRAGGGGGKDAVTATLRGNGGAKDRLRVSTTPSAKRATATLFKVVKGKKQQVGKKALNKRGKATFVKRDFNGNRVTKYFVRVSSTKNTRGDRSNTVRVK